DEEKLPGLLVAIAQNYRTLNQPSNAITYYRSAYSVSQRFEQFSISAQVLKDLGILYETLALNDEALGAYNLLVPVEQQAYNNYGIMNAYDSIGQLHRKQGNDFEALQAFEKALVIANRLGIQEDYFIEQIRSVT
ncbi:MAG: tetratricopeptide repeat protein, partial [Cyanobacteria bacterium J06635_11]